MVEMSLCGATLEAIPSSGYARYGLSLESFFARKVSSWASEGSACWSLIHLSSILERRRLGCFSKGWTLKGSSSGDVYGGSSMGGEYKKVNRGALRGRR